MEDTPSEIRKLVHEIIMSRTEEERFLMCAQMFEDAKELAKINMPADLTPPQQTAYVYRRLHGEDMPSRNNQ